MRWIESMRSVAIVLIVALLTPTVSAQEPGGAPAQATPEPPSQAGAPPTADLPVSLDRIRKELEKTPAIIIDTSGEQPTFKIEVQERNRLQDILSTLDFSAGPTPAGGIYAAEMQRVMFPPASNPLRQPLAAFSQPELLTILIETLAGTYLAKKVAAAITDADREAAEAAAKAELQRAIALYCAGQPNNGAGITICTRGAAAQ